MDTKTHQPSPVRERIETIVSAIFSSGMMFQAKEWLGREYTLETKRLHADDLEALIMSEREKGAVELFQLIDQKFESFKISEVMGGVLVEYRNSLKQKDV